MKWKVEGCRTVTTTMGGVIDKTTEIVRDNDVFADFFGVYAILPSGMVSHVCDFATRAEAEAYGRSGNKEINELHGKELEVSKVKINPVEVGERFQIEFAFANKRWIKTLRWAANMEDDEVLDAEMVTDMLGEYIILGLEADENRMRWEAW